MKHLNKTFFSYAELIKSERAKLENIENIPTPEYAYNLGRISQHLDNIRSLVNRPIIVNSGFRTEKLNTILGGVRNSYHRYGLAVDITTIGYYTLLRDVVISYCGFQYKTELMHYENDHFEVHLYPTRNFIHFAIKF